MSLTAPADDVPHRVLHDHLTIDPDTGRTWTVVNIEHERGTGSRLMAVVVEAGIGWRLAATWAGTRWDERRLKRWGGLARHCPVCKGRSR